MAIVEKRVVRGNADRKMVEWITKRRRYRLIKVVLVVLSFSFTNSTMLFAAGQNPIKEVSDTIEALCPQLAALNANGLLTPSQQDVFFRCREVKIQPGEDFDDLTDTDKNALGNMTSAQTSSMSRSTVEFAAPQVATVAGRLQALRAGAVGGLAMNIDADTPEPVLYAGPVTAMPDNTSSSMSSSMWDTGRLGIFINGALGTGSRDQTFNEIGFDFDTYTLTAGVDYRITNNLVLGTALGYAYTEADMESNAGNVESDGYGISVFGTYYLDQLFFDLIGVYGKKDFSIRRNINYQIPAVGTTGTTQVDQSFQGDPDADEFGFSAGVGYNVDKGGFNFQPFAQLSYLETDIDGYTESISNANTNAGFGLAMKVDEQNIKSMVSILGGRVSYAMPTSIGVFVPQLSFDWKHEYENDARNMTARFVNGTNLANNLILIPTDDPDRDYFGLGLGVSAVFARGMSGFANYDTLLDLANVTYHQVTLGIRFEI